MWLEEDPAAAELGWKVNFERHTVYVCGRSITQPLAWTFESGEMVLTQGRD